MSTEPALSLALTVDGRLDAALDASPGDVVAVLGPNGAGKSTLLAAVAGLVPARGHLRVHGEDWLDRPVRDRRLGMLFQDRLLFPHLSARDNVAFGLRSRGTDRRTARQRADVWLDRVGVAELADRRPGALSGGQAQRVALARALVLEPDLLLLDEPMGALDVGAAAALRLELARQLYGFAGVTLLVTHDAVDALTLASRVVVLEDGLVRQAGTPAEVAARPRTDHVARLVGLNVVRGQSRGTEVHLRDGRVLRTATAYDGAAHVCFAAGAVALGRTEPEGSVRNRWRGRVRGLTAQENRVRVMVDLDGRPDDGRPVLADVTTMAAAELGLDPGQPVWVSVKATEMSVYAA